MDPTESIFYPLDCMYDSLAQRFDDNDVTPSNLFSSRNDFDDLFGSDEFFNRNNFVEDFLNPDNLINDFYNDQILFPIIGSSDNDLGFGYGCCNEQNAGCYYQSATKQITKSSNTSINNSIEISSRQSSSNFLRDKKNNLVANSSAKIINRSPRVYVTKINRKIRKTLNSCEGTSILIKEKSLLNTGKKKQRQLMKKNFNNFHIRFQPSQNSLMDLNSLGESIFHEKLDTSLIDHDYCAVTSYDRIEEKKDNVCGDDDNISVPNDSILKTQDDDKNDLQDILEGYCTDDVVLNELPKCLSNLIDFNADGIESKDLLNGLNDVCTYMTDQFMEEHFQKTENKDANNSEIDNAAKTQQNLMSDSNEKLNSQQEKDKHQDVNDDHKDLESFSPSAHMVDDSSDSNCGIDDISDYDKSDHCDKMKRIGEQNRKKNLMIGSQMNFLSNTSTNPSSNTIVKRKRLFSTRSSINSSDSMSDSSSPESSSSRSSSPERTFDFRSFSPKMIHTKDLSDLHTNLHHHHARYRKKNNKPLQLFQIAYHQNKNVGDNFSSNSRYSKLLKKSNPKLSPSSSTSSCEPCQVIDFVSKQKYVLGSRSQNKCETIAIADKEGHIDKNHQTSSIEPIEHCPNDQMAVKEQKNSNVLFVGNIGDGTTHQSIQQTFEKFGSIEKIEFFVTNEKNSASIAFRCGDDTRKAFENGNELSGNYHLQMHDGNDRNLEFDDSFSEKLDFRIEPDAIETIFT
ncbi:major facilitator superfamily transporter [Sarcoptes scabiei]|nr:major facilitator superfamily transporter [Sarcoptes scabiei]